MGQQYLLPCIFEFPDISPAINNVLYCGLIPAFTMSYAAARRPDPLTRQNCCNLSKRVTSFTIYINVKTKNGVGLWSGVGSSNGIQVNTGCPAVDFSATPTSGPAPLLVQFTDVTAGNAIARLWDFGDGATSTLQNPEHLYNNAGVYTVTLTVTGTVTSNTLQKASYIQVNPNSYLLTITKAGTGSGTVTSIPPEISCGVDCQETFSYGTAVTLTAQAGAGWTFAGWSGDCTGGGQCVVTMDQARSITATFTLNSYLLTVAKAGTGSGTVMSNPPGIDCGPDCQELFTNGTVVTLTAQAATGSTFTGWSGACTGAGQCVVTIDNAKSATATFTKTGYKIYIPLIRNIGSAGTLPTGEGLTSPVAFSTSPVINITQLLKQLPLLLWTYLYPGGAV
jgi:uncharacterized repeat protein (TIGR02543 family)